MTSLVVVLASLLLLVATGWSRDDAAADTVEYRLTEESPTGTVVGDLLHDVPSLADDEHQQRLHFSIVTSRTTSSAATNHVLAQFTIGERDGRLVTSSPVNRERACTLQRDVTDCVIRLDVAVRPLAVFRLIRVAVIILDINDHAPVFSSTRYIL